MNKEGGSRATWLRVTDQCFCRVSKLLLWKEVASRVKVKDDSMQVFIKVSFNSSSYVKKFNSCPIHVGNATLKIFMYHLNLCFVFALLNAKNLLLPITPWLIPSSHTS